MIIQINFINTTTNKWKRQFVWNHRHCSTKQSYIFNIKLKKMIILYT